MRSFRHFTLAIRLKKKFPCAAFGRACLTHARESLCTHTQTHSPPTPMADVLTALAPGGALARDRVLRDKAAAAVDVLDRTLDLYGCVVCVESVDGIVWAR